MAEKGTNQGVSENQDATATDTYRHAKDMR
jgi:hypothetical protein